ARELPPDALRPDVPGGDRTQRPPAARGPDPRPARAAPRRPALRGSARLALPPRDGLPAVRAAGPGRRGDLRPAPAAERAPQPGAPRRRPRRCRVRLARRPDLGALGDDRRDRLEGARLRRDPLPRAPPLAARRDVRGGPDRRRALLAPPPLRDHP